MRASDRLRRFETEDRRGRLRRGSRSPAFWTTQVLFVLGILCLLALLESDDPSSVDDSLIQVALGALGLLGAVLLALLLAGAPVLPCVSALLPPVVIFAIPWRDVHSAAGSTWIWLLCHLLVLGWTLARPSRG